MIHALLADVHSNLEALEACLRHASTHGAQRFAFLGDFVGYGADPAAVVDVVAGYAARGAVVVKGNHEAVIGNGSREEVAVWTRNALSAAHKAFLAALPLCVRDDDICFVHSKANEPQKWEYIDTASAARESIDAASTTYTFAGHLHQQILYFKTMAGKIAPFRPTPGSAVPVPSHRSWMAIVGAVGQPRDGNPAAGYALFDSTNETMTFYRVPYDHLTAAAKIRRAGLPEWLAYRVENGI